MPDADEPFGEYVEEEAPDELSDRTVHDAVCSATAVIFVAEGDVASLQREESAIRDGHAVGIAGEIFQDLLRGAEGRLGVNNPLGLVEAIEEGVPRTGRSQFLQLAGKDELAGFAGLTQVRQVLSSEEAAEYPNGKEESLAGRL